MKKIQDASVSTTFEVDLAAKSKSLSNECPSSFQIDRASSKHFDEKQQSKIRRRFAGKVLFPRDYEYDNARAVFNGRIDRRPALILQCSGVADVVQAIQISQEHELPLSVRGGGHSAAGFGVRENGLMIDLSQMKGLRVQSKARIATAQPGVTWGLFDRETQMFGLACTGARISNTGISGVTLGGGYGWLMRKFGLTIDSLISADVVTADGEVLTVNEVDHPDLYWGIRGGGGNFGIVTSFQYRLNPVGPMVTGGMAFYPASSIRKLLTFFRNLMSNAPDELGAILNFLIMPSAPFVPEHLRGIPVVAIAVCHIGSTRQAEIDLAALQELGTPLMNRIEAIPYCKLQQMFDAAGAFGFHVHGRSGHLVDLTADVIDTLVRYAPKITSSYSILMISSLGGAVGRVHELATAFGCRQAKYDFAINSVWKPQDDPVRHVAWAESFWNSMRDFSIGVYVNELGDEGEDRVKQAYNPQAYQRLRDLKRKFDLKNVFSFNQNIKP